MILGKIITAIMDALLLRGGINGLFSIAIRQGVIGLLGALVDIIVFHLVLQTGIFSLHGAVNAGWITAFFIVYFFHKYYTFRHVKKHRNKTLKQITLYLCAFLISLGLSHIIVRFLVMILGFIPVIAKVISIVLIFFYSLLVNKRFVFSSAIENS